MEGGLASLKGIVWDIDHLTSWKIAQRWHLQIPGQLKLRGGAFGALQRLADELPYHVRQLEERAASYKGPAPLETTAVVPSPQVPEVRVETRFDIGPPLGPS
jgi:hypothetical protein